VIQEFDFHIQFSGREVNVSQVELAEYAEIVGLEQAVPGRWAWLFVLTLKLHEDTQGTDPFAIVEEIKSLEGKGQAPGTKPPTVFKREPLKGLWHKHFFSAQFLPKNLLLQLAGGRLRAKVEDIGDPKKYPVVTKDMIDELAQEIVEGTYESRANEGKLTGEWILFSKHAGQNYYLCIANHGSGDQEIFDMISTIGYRQFPFLESRA